MISFAKSGVSGRKKIDTVSFAKFETNGFFQSMYISKDSYNCHSYHIPFSK